MLLPSTKLSLQSLSATWTTYLTPILKNPNIINMTSHLKKQTRREQIGSNLWSVDNTWTLNVYHLRFLCCFQKNKQRIWGNKTNIAIKRFRIFYGIRVLILTFQLHFIKVILIFLRNLHWWVKPRDRDGDHPSERREVVGIWLISQ